MASAKIEGNHTALADLHRQQLEGKAGSTHRLPKIAYIETAMDYLKEVIKPGAV
nr:hypothetical protein [Pseudomonas sp. AFG_SD02_1510_Pfu_092]